MSGSFVSGRCSGAGRSDTTCSLCRTACKAGQKGVVPQRPGEYIAGQCTGKTFGDVQSCIPCKTCPEGEWPSGVCDGLSYADSIVCTPCATMASCPNATHYYLQGNCAVEEVKCQLCDPPCDTSLYVETRACGQDGQNRICTPKTLCLEPQCPAGFWESVPCTVATGPKVCSRCSKCREGEYVAQACSAKQDTQCLPCRSSCRDLSATKNGMIGTCNSTDTYDVVQCTYSATPVAQACAADEWLAGTLTTTFQECNMSAADSGTPSNLQHPFRSDVAPDGTRMVFLGSSGSGSERQVLVLITEVGTGKVVNYVFPRVAYYNRIDAYGSQKDASSAYPIATLLTWSATDAMLSYDGRSVYLFFSDTFDFIGRCALTEGGRELQASDCGVLSPAALSYASLGNNNYLVHKGCVRTVSRTLICLYDAKGTDTYLFAVDESMTNQSKALVESSATVGGLRRPKSSPAWNGANMTAYYIADVNNGQEHAVRYVTMDASGRMVRSSGYMYRGVSAASPDYHSLVWNGNYLVAADRSRLVSFAGLVRSERDTGETSIKDLAVQGSAGQLLVLVHAQRMWTMYTHCAPCPLNAWSPAGSTTAGIAACKCRDDFFGKIERQVFF